MIIGNAESVAPKKSVRDAAVISVLTTVLAAAITAVLVAALVAVLAAAIAVVLAAAIAAVLAAAIVVVLAAALEAVSKAALEAVLAAALEAVSAAGLEAGLAAALEAVSAATLAAAFRAVGGRGFRWRRLTPRSSYLMGDCISLRPMADITDGITRQIPSLSPILLTRGGSMSGGLGVGALVLVLERCD